MNVSPKKSLGQHFLRDEKTLQRILDAAELSSGDSVIEIGAGPGVLSAAIAPHVKKLLSLEIDQRFEKPWKELMKPFSNADLFLQDVLQFTPPDQAYKLVANIPYYITSPILKHFLRHQKGRRPEFVVLLIQKEVAQRIVDEEKPTLLSWEIRIFGKASIEAFVPASAFFPPPKVDSAILKIKVFPEALIPMHLFDSFFRMLSQAYRQPRKMLLNNLPHAESWKTMVNPKLRAHQLGLHQWKILFQEFLKF